jgi:ubiquinone/menaquinone biosynthesis C-methylase UbiE
MTSDAPLAHDAFEQLADVYAARIDTKPHNAYYERPAMLSLLPDVAGLHVLDAGCGPGIYAEWLVQRGARVVAVDCSARMLEHARARAGASVEYHEADLEAAWDFSMGGSLTSSLPRSSWTLSPIGERCSGAGMHCCAGVGC